MLNMLPRGCPAPVDPSAEHRSPRLSPLLGVPGISAAQGDADAVEALE